MEKLQRIENQFKNVSTFEPSKFEIFRFFKVILRHQFQAETSDRFHSTRETSGRI